jgi:hypothetical protein
MKKYHFILIFAAVVFLIYGCEKEPLEIDVEKEILEEMESQNILPSPLPSSKEMRLPGNDILDWQMWSTLFRPPRNRFILFSRSQN